MCEGNELKTNNQQDCDSGCAHFLICDFRTNLFIIIRGVWTIRWVRATGGQ